MEQPRRVVITGLGTVSPLGLSVSETWDGIVKGRSGIDNITGFDPSACACRFAGEVKGFDPYLYFSKKDAKKYDRAAHFAVAAAVEALRDSGLDLAGCAERVGVILGSGFGGFASIAHTVDVFLNQGPDRLSPFTIPSTIINTISGLVAIQLGAKGPNYSVVSACATGNHAIADAFHVIRRGEADAMVTGSAEAAIHPIALSGFANMRALSLRNNEPQRACRPFDRDRDGFVMGEGCGALILEDLETALARGARIYGEILGIGMNSDAYHITAPDPGGAGVGTCMTVALANSGLKPEQIDYINAHGTSTPINDPVETLGIKRAFGEHAYRLAVSSTKSMTGHLLGAAGSVEAILTTLAIYHQILPPTINLEHPDPECDLDYVPNSARPAKIHAAISNSFGFGSTNATLVLQRYEREDKKIPA